MCLPRRFDQTEAPRPYRLALVRRIASAMVFTRFIAIVGPKVSSVIAIESSGTSQKITGSTKGAFTEPEPPIKTVAPRAIASSICD